MASPFVSPSPIGNAQKSLSQERDRWFDSGSLQRGVYYKPDFWGLIRVRAVT